MGMRFARRGNNAAAAASRRCRHRSTAAAAILLHLLLILLVIIEGGAACNVHQCWGQYSQRLATDKIVQGPNVAYCAALRTFSECIRSSARSCRGDLHYHAFSSSAQNWSNNNNCSYIVLHASSAPPVVHAAASSPHHHQRSSTSGSVQQQQQCAYHGRHDFRYCALFGDPHLRTFDGAELTCRALGAWPLVDNAYLAVQVTNEAVGLFVDSDATATTKVTVIVKGGVSVACSSPKTYEAQVDHVPSAFVDGTASSGAVRVREREPGAHVELHVRYIATTVVVRQVGRHLTVAVRMPRDVVRQGVVDDDLQLCVGGCPTVERLALVTSSSSAMSRDEAVLRCRQHNLTSGFFFDACVFDLMSTGDPVFGVAARKAMHDFHHLSPELVNSAAAATNLTSGGDIIDPADHDDDRKRRPASSGGGGAAAAPNLLLLLLTVTSLPLSFV